METTRLYLANGLTRTVKGRAEDIGAALKARKLGGEDGIRQFITTDGDTITVNVGGILLTEAATGATRNKAFGFARALEV